MSTLLVVFLAAHGLLHLAIWLPHPQPTDTAPPFHPDHSAALTAVHAPLSVVRAMAPAMATTAAGSYLIAASGVALGTEWAGATALAASLLGLLLKSLYFHPWLLMGIALDGLVLTAAVADWPVSLV